MNQNELMKKKNNEIGQNIDETHLLKYLNVIWVLNMVLIKDKKTELIDSSRGM